MEVKTLLATGLMGAFSLVASPALADAFNLKHEHVPNQLIVKFKANASLASQQMLLEEIQAKPVYQFKANAATLIEFSGQNFDGNLYNYAQQLAEDPNVEYVEANTIIRLKATIPNDPSFDELYGLHNEGATGGAVDADIDAPEAWDFSTGSKDVLVGVIDTGIDYTHPDIAPNYWTNPGETGKDSQGRDKATNGIDDDGNGYVDDWRGWDFANNDNDPMDDNRHGTHCAGTIGAAGNDGVGVAGVSWNVSMVGIKFLSGSGSGTLEDAVKAIEYATKIGVTLTSNSWGGGGFSETMHAAIEQANEAGVLFVAAAGNSSSDNDTAPHYPSNYDLPNVISVAATDHNDALAYFSSYGQRTVHLAAPGTDILSTTPGNRYQKLSGTSMATPHVSGVAALIKAAFPDYSALQIKERLLKTVDPVNTIATASTTGGRLNAYNALEPDAIAPGQVFGVELADRSTTSVRIRWNATGDDGDAGKASRYQVRFAEKAIVSDDDWANATPLAVSNVDATLDQIEGDAAGLPFNTSGYFAVRAVDNVGNEGPISESVWFELIKVQVIATNDAESMEGIDATGTWNIQEVEGAVGHAFSDSPEGNYENNQNASLKLPAFESASKDVTVVFEHKYDFETNYDFGYLELSTDGGKTWKELRKYTGANAWSRETVSLSDHLSDGATFQLRLRITSDYALTRDGWYVDTIQLVAPKM